MVQLATHKCEKGDPSTSQALLQRPLRGGGKRPRLPRVPDAPEAGTQIAGQAPSPKQRLQRPLAVPRERSKARGHNHDLYYHNKTWAERDRTRVYLNKLYLQGDSYRDGAQGQKRPRERR